MKALNRKLCPVLLLMAVLTLSAMQTSFGSAEVDNSEEVLSFMRDVIKYDLDAYNVTLYGATNTADLDLVYGLDQTVGVYHLESEDDEINVAFKVTNNKISWCAVYVLKGTPKYTQSMPTNVNEAAKDFLARYQTFAKDSSLASIASALDNIDLTKNASNIVGNIKLKTTATANSNTLSCRNTYNGADYAAMVVKFENGEFRAFKDHMNYYTIGDTTVNISREEAIATAQECIKGYSYEFEGKQVADFNIVEDKITASLLTQSRYGDFELYPYWRVTFPLANLYPGYVNSIEVTLWADKGDIIDCSTLGFDAILPSDESTDESSTQPLTSSLSTEGNKDSESNAIVTSWPAVNIIIVALIASVSLISVFVIVKKKAH